jgi:hypothetical protein
MNQDYTSNNSENLSGRDAALARRRALSLYGKKAIPGAEAKTRPSAHQRPGASQGAAPQPALSAAPILMPTPSESPAAVPAKVCDCANKVAQEVAAPIVAMSRVAPSAAQQRRINQSLRGRGNKSPARPCGRVPCKVETSTTLSGAQVSGSQLERTPSTTGNEAGTCRIVTGTEYLGAEHYNQFCDTKPLPSPAKVSMSSTSRGGRVTGTEIGRSQKVSGDETGTCKRVTGTEYLAAEQTRTFCGTSPEPHHDKSGFGMTALKNKISGTDLTRGIDVTGGESGANRTITGSDYTDVTALRRKANDAPKKVEISHTSAGGTVSGTLVGRSKNVSGSERGACERITGSDYLSSEEFASFCRAEPYQPPAKVGVSLTAKGQSVSGTQVGRSYSVTGDEYGACKPVTGSSYIGADQYAEFCADRAVAEASNRFQRAQRVIPASRQASVQRAQQDQPIDAPKESARVMPCGSFSIVSPAQSARDTTQRITGSAYGGTDRITGSLARATGKISGTPEFRYRDDIEAPVEVAVDTKERSPERITGEGRERNVTGDAWDRGDRITGTEGLSAARRNPTWRGEPRLNGATKNAREFRKAEQPEAQPSRVTGCSGSSMAGAAVTMSGGARG